MGCLGIKKGNVTPPSPPTHNLLYLNEELDIFSMTRPTAIIFLKNIGIWQIPRIQNIQAFKKFPKKEKIFSDSQGTILLVRGGKAFLRFLQLTRLSLQLPRIFIFLILGVRVSISMKTTRLVHWSASRLSNHLKKHLGHNIFIHFQM